MRGNDNVEVEGISDQRHDGDFFNKFVVRKNLVLRKVTRLLAGEKPIVT